MKNFTPYLFLFAILLLGCTKDESETNVNLTSKTWKPSLVDKNVSSNPSGQVIYNAV